MKKAEKYKQYEKYEKSFAAQHKHYCSILCNIPRKLQQIPKAQQTLQLMNNVCGAQIHIVECFWLEFY